MFHSELTALVVSDAIDVAIEGSVGDNGSDIDEDNNTDCVGQICIFFLFF